ncbi:MAG: diphthine--ammonia ligase [Theionarchaea archaeon]|nr:diphthine--ammonia ligase [Theionarchaea archaeon]
MTPQCRVNTSNVHEPEKVLLSWSGGKDSALSLYELQKTDLYDVRALLTTVTEDYNRSSMHGVRSVLLEQQADSVGIPLEKVFMPKTVSYEEYESIMQKVCEYYLNAGIFTVVFGDIFLEDVREYREKNLEKIGMKASFPLWGKDTVDIAHEFINLGFKAITTCIDSHVLGKDFVGRDFDEKFLNELPPSVDPCGEHGEFHSFVYDGPVFRKKISCTRGEVVFRENRFYYCDLLPGLPF